MPEMKFTEYEKMSLSLERFKETEKALKEEWIVTEKIHGANFSFHSDGTKCLFARRRDFLKDDEAFYSYKKAEFFKGFPDKINDVFKEVQNFKCEIEIGQVIVFGELFGGKYDHPDIRPTKGKPVQMEIQYCPDIKFASFDIAYRKKNEDGTLDEQEYLDISLAMSIFEKFGLFYMKPLFKGKASDALNFKIGFDSTIPKQLGLPELPKGSNVAEGVVVRPLKNILAVGPFGDKNRVIVKIKVPEFDETRNQKGDKKRIAVKTMNRPDKQLIPIMIQYITENRMVSAAVKTGHPDNEEIEKNIKEEFMQDVMDELLQDEEHLTLWESCDEKQKQAIKKCLQGKTHGLFIRYKDRFLSK